MSFKVGAKVTYSYDINKKTIRFLIEYTHGLIGLISKDVSDNDEIAVYETISHIDHLLSTITI